MIKVARGLLNKCLFLDSFKDVDLNLKLVLYPLFTTVPIQVMSIDVNMKLIQGKRDYLREKCTR